MVTRLPSCQTQEPSPQNAALTPQKWMVLARRISRRIITARVTNKSDQSIAWHVSLNLLSSFGIGSILVESRALFPVEPFHID
jgi:hypothetical protein